MRALLLTLIVALGGCTQTIGEGDPLPLAPNFLRLQSWVAVAADGNANEGFLRWLYLADDPTTMEEGEDPREYCEVWEKLELDRVDAASCVGCTDLWDGVASVVDEDTTCLGVDWTDRAYSLGFGALDSAPEDVAAMASEGYTHAVYVDWAPDVGDLSGHEALFVAEPERWSSDTAPIGTSGGQPVAGDYHLFSLYYWDVREADVP